VGHQSAAPLRIMMVIRGCLMMESGERLWSSGARRPARGMRCEGGRGDRLPEHVAGPFSDAAAPSAAAWQPSRCHGAPARSAAAYERSGACAVRGRPLVCNTPELTCWCCAFCACTQFEAPYGFNPMRGPVLFYYSPSAPLKTYSENPICNSYLGSNCVAMGSGVKDDWSGAPAPPPP